MKSSKAKLFIKLKILKSLKKSSKAKIINKIKIIKNFNEIFK
jgi:hypothetical protein